LIEVEEGGRGFIFPMRRLTRKSTVPPMTRVRPAAKKAFTKAASKKALAVKPKERLKVSGPAPRALFGIKPPKNAARSAAAKSRAPKKGSQAAMMIGTRLRAARSNRKVFPSIL